MKNKVLIIIILLVIAVGILAIYEINNMRANNSDIGNSQNTSDNASNNVSDNASNNVSDSASDSVINVDEEFNLAMKDMEEKQNIIDSSFLPLFEFGDATYLLNVITEYYQDAWRNELKSINSDISQTDEKAIEIQNKIINQLGNSTGVTYYSNIAKATVYRKAVLNSIDSVHEYIFKPSSLDELKEMIGFEDNAK